MSSLLITLKIKIVDCRRKKKIERGGLETKRNFRVVWFCLFGWVSILDHGDEVSPVVPNNGQIRNTITFSKIEG
jgi:hypothetical protein